MICIRSGFWWTVALVLLVFGGKTNAQTQGTLLIEGGDRAVRYNQDVTTYCDNPGSTTVTFTHDRVDMGKCNDLTENPNPIYNGVVEFVCADPVKKMKFLKFSCKNEGSYSCQGEFNTRSTDKQIKIADFTNLPALKEFSRTDDFGNMDPGPNLNITCTTMTTKNETAFLWYKDGAKLEDIKTEHKVGSDPRTDCLFESSSEARLNVKYEDGEKKVKCQMDGRDSVEYSIPKINQKVVSVTLSLATEYTVVCKVNADPVVRPPPEIRLKDAAGVELKKVTATKLEWQAPSERRKKTTFLCTAGNHLNVEWPSENKTLDLSVPVTTTTPEPTTGGTQKPGSSPKPKTGLETWIIIVISVCGGILLIVIVVVILICCLLRGRKKKKPLPANDQYRDNAYAIANPPKRQSQLTPARLEPIPPESFRPDFDPPDDDDSFSYENFHPPSPTRRDNNYGSHSSFQEPLPPHSDDDSVIYTQPNFVNLPRSRQPIQGPAGMDGGYANASPFVKRVQTSEL